MCLFQGFKSRQTRACRLEHCVQRLAALKPSGRTTGERCVDQNIDTEHQDNSQELLCAVSGFQARPGRTCRLVHGMQRFEALRQDHSERCADQQASAKRRNSS